MNYDKAKVIAAAQAAAVSNVSHLTDDRVEALTGGHGMLNIAIHTVANSIYEDLTAGGTVSIKNADARQLPVESVLKKAIETAKNTGADNVNAALIVATMMYLVGCKAQVGIPAGNRKLGATCRMLAGVDRSGAQAIPTSKMNNKISAFPAVMAVNQALLDGRISPISGYDLPDGISGSPLFGHSKLGEDIVWPEMAKRGAEIGTQAMMDAMAGAGIQPNPFQAAVLGSTPILEIIHPDAEVPESEGQYGRTTSVRLVGKAAAAKAGLPETLHMFLTGQEFDTGQLVGDLALILKDIGGPSVIGIMAFDEIVGIFREGVAGSGASPVNPPLGHVGSYTMALLKAMLEEDADPDVLMKALVAERSASSVCPESAILGINIIARKASEVKRGKITDLLIDATEPYRTKYIYDKASFAYDQMMEGKTVAEVCRALDDERLASLEKSTGEYLTKKTGEPVTIKVENVRGGARRTSKLAKKYPGFDLNCDITVTQGEKTAYLPGFAHDIIPKVAQGQCRDIAWAVPFAAIPARDIALAGCNILNIVVPAAVAAILTEEDLAEMAESADRASYISAGIPGGKAHAKAVGKLARSIAEVLL